jgi:RNA recognition motif-containing protein
MALPYPTRRPDRDPESPLRDFALSAKRARMGKKLFVGNLPYTMTDDELRELFAAIGACESASVVMDRDSGQSRGFGFVVMVNPEDAERAKRELDGTDVKGRKMRVDVANDQSSGGRGPRPRSGPR